MTDNVTDWDAAFAHLKARFPRIRDTILFCLHAIQQNPDIYLDDLKSLAEMHRLRITGASLAAARRLLAAESRPPAMPVVELPRVPRARMELDDTDPVTMIQAFVSQMQEQGDDRSQKLRAAVREAIAVLQAAIE